MSLFHYYNPPCRALGELAWSESGIIVRPGDPFAIGEIWLIQPLQKSGKVCRSVTKTMMLLHVTWQKSVVALCSQVRSSIENWYWATLCECVCHYIVIHVYVSVPFCRILVLCKDKIIVRSIGLLKSLKIRFFVWICFCVWCTRPFFLVELISNLDSWPLAGAPECPSRGNYTAMMYHHPYLA